MGYGDELVASSFAKGAKARGKRIAFGDGKTIDWHPFAKQIFIGNPNVAPPGSERDPDIEWVDHYRGHRCYVRDNKIGKWTYIPHTIKQPGEVFLLPEEEQWAARHFVTEPFVLIEPSIPHFKAMARNKQWPVGYYQQLTDLLIKAGYSVVQFRYNPPFGPGNILHSTDVLDTPSFRHSLALMRRAKFYVGPEGGMHHGAAAVGTPAVVIFGGYISPDITGYAHHYNHYVGGEPCGRFEVCQHCAEALASITVEQVFESCQQIMKGKTNGNV